MDKKITDDLRQAYDSEASARNTAKMQDWKEAERNDFLVLLKEEKKRTILEIGSGPGRDGLYFAENGFEVTCTDLSSEHVKLCQEKGLHARVLDVHDLDYPDGSFDAVYAMNSLLHIPKAEFPGILRSIHAVLKLGGLFYMGIYGGHDFEGIYEHDRLVPNRFFSFYPDDEIRHVISEVFNFVRFDTVNVPGRTVGHFQSLTLRK